MSRPTPFTRRGLLRAAGASVALPLLESLPAAKLPLVHTETPAARALWVYFPNGTPEGSWEPERVDARGRLQQLNASMRALEPHRADLCVLRGAYTPEGNGHGAGTATWLTGGDWNEENYDAGGASVDQLLAREVGQRTLLPSLELGVEGEGFFSHSLVRNSISWRSARVPVHRDRDPRIDFRAQAHALASEVSRADAERVEEYLEAVRAVERRISFVTSEQTQRRLDQGRRALDEATGGELALDHGETLRLHMELIALAFWAGVTRVASLMLDHGQSNRYFDFLPEVKGTWHALSHWQDISGDTEDDDGVTSWSSRGQKRAMYERVVSWHHEHVAALLERLAGYAEGEERLLDHTLVVYGSNLADGHEHGEEDLPVILAGGGALNVSTGRLLGSARREQDLNGLHLAVMRRMGSQARRFGSARREWSDLEA